MKKSLLLLFAVCSIVGAFAASQTIYDNTDNYLIEYNETLLESGDQVQFAGSNRVIDYFAFEYFAKLTTTPSGNEKARVRFYLNDGAVGANPAPTPGTLLYDSGMATITSGVRTVEISDLNVFVPSNTLTWTVEFSGLDSTETAGVLFYDPPTVGSSGNFLWQKETNVWAAVAREGLTNNLSALFTAVAAVQIESLQLQANTATLVMAATSGKYYSLEYKTNANQVGWIALNGPSVRATSDHVTLKDSTLAGGKLRIYRVVERDTATATADRLRQHLS
jgi:hypothetical protein